MSVKPVVSLALGLAVVTLVSCLDTLDDTSPYFRQYSTIISTYGDLSQCNKTQCGPPCPGAAPPPSCPEVVPNCLSGCVCLLDCEHAVTNCFEAQHCLETLYLTRKKRKRPSSDEILE